MLLICRYVKEADPDIIKWLKQQGRLVNNEKLEHSYPFCWRSDTPLLYKVPFKLCPASLSMSSLDNIISDIACKSCSRCLFDCCGTIRRQFPAGL